MARRVLAIINPISGRRRMTAVVRAVGRRLEHEGASLALEVTQGVGHGARLARQAAPHIDAVLVVGGDGTVCDVLNGLTAHRVPIVILRTGTENLLAREFRMPTDPGQVAATLLRGKPVACDVGVVNERRFLAVTGVGFDAEVVARLVRVRAGHIGYFDYFWPIWRTFWAHRFPPLRVEVDGTCVFAGQGLAILGVIGRYSLGLRILKHARPDDGLLDVCVFPCTSRTQLALHAFNVLRGRHLDHVGVVYRQGRTLEITSPKRVPVEVDGEWAGHLPIKCSIIPHAVTLLRL